MSFPSNPTNGQQYTDKNGTNWKYNSVDNSWTSTGTKTTLTQVTTQEPGIITPAIYNKLVKLEELTKSLNLDLFKIAPGLDAYYYYLYSPDKLINITYRNNTISIDVNESKLIAYLYRNLCKGDKGETGQTGEAGEPGLPAPNEQFYNPTKNNKTLTGQVYVPIPIGTYHENEEITPISLRLYETYQTDNSKSSQLSYWTSTLSNPNIDVSEKKIYAALQKKILEESLSTDQPTVILSTISSNTNIIPNILFEADINPVDGKITIISNGVTADTNNLNITYDKSIGLLKFSITANWPSEMLFKARQRGPKGKRGKIPNNYLILNVQDFPTNTNVRPNNVLTHLRYDNQNGKLFANYSRLDSQDAFHRISTDPTATTTATKPVLEGNYVGVEKVASDIKNTVPLIKDRYKIEVDDPNFLNWSPQPGCVTKRNYNNQDFDWVPKTDLPACDTNLTWFGPEGIRTGKYPFEIKKQQEPSKDECCQDDFFYFPESGDC